ncbi:VCBS repeat-containing protein [Glycomyces sp. NPDC047010]|uniref:VCBS repeat-containing protein n=1 Tax=Glycomyces sp. NPDC047010 TaxID=3155023 RepID=UPI0033FDB4C6
MNEAPRNRRPRRIAAVAATAIGAAMLAAPGTATAQDDCAALGDNPMAESAETALELAAACGVEVRVDNRADPHSTVSVTPEGRLHLTATVDAVQEQEDRGYTDTTLVPTGDSLTAANGGRGMRLPFTDGVGFLLLTGSTELDWDGAVPTPEYSGSTAVYEELAPGLDLAADMDASSVEFVFTIADAAAWNELASGLSIGEGMDPYTGDRASASDGVLRIDNPLAPYYRSAQSSLFTVRGSDGETAAADVALGTDRSVTLALPDGAVETAAFPLTLSTQWAESDFRVNEWGSVTSAAPGLPLFRGNAGLGEPYFEAAGESADAVVGPYCDALAAADCAAPATAAAYWNFQWPFLDELPADAFDTDFPVESATFRVDAADGADCTAPDLEPASAYVPDTTWDTRPAAIGADTSGTCEDGTAVYDVTDTIAGVWADPLDAAAVTFGMTDSAETARFDGGSARLDVTFDAVGFRYFSPRTCGTEAAPRFQRNDPAEFAGFYADTWGSPVKDLGVTWTADIRNADTGAVVTTEPEPLAFGINPFGAIELDDGRYEVVYEFTASEADFEYRSATCHMVVDRSAPEILDVDVDGGKSRVGDTMTVEVDVADAGFPDGDNDLTVFCQGYESCDSRSEVLSDGTTATFELPMNRTSNWLRISLRDKAGNTADTVDMYIRASYSRFDFNGDGAQDLFTVRESDGKLVFFAGNGDGTFKSGVAAGTGWGGSDIVMAGDLTGDQVPDLLARDTRTGTLRTYPGAGNGTLRDPIAVGTGWNRISVFTSAGDYDNDGKLDLLAVRESDGKLYRYPGRGDGTFGAATAVGTGWGAMDMLSTYGDLDGNGYTDLLTRSEQDSHYYVYMNDGNGGFNGKQYLPYFLGEDYHGPESYDQVLGGGDYNQDGYADLLAVNDATGQMVLRSWDENSIATVAEQVVGSGWYAYRLPATVADRTYDYDEDNRSDIVAVDSRGTSTTFLGNGTGGFTGQTWTDPHFEGYNLVETAGDLNGDGNPDLLARKTSNGALYLVPGFGQGQFEEEALVKIGTGWNAMSAIVSGHDFNGDGRIDVLARESATGYLWLYKGNGDGTVGSRVKIGSGWNALDRITAVGDLDHDGHADLLAVRTSDNCLYRYDSTGTGTLQSGVKVGCGWAGLDALASVGDFDGDGHADLVARRKSDGKLFLYKGNGAGGFTSAVAIGTGWNRMSVIA